MNIETLVVTVDRFDHSLCEGMNLQTDAVIGNQNGNASEETFQLKGHRFLWLDLPDRGVGRNRNAVLSRSGADWCVLADDDLRFLDGYPKTLSEAIRQCPKADILVFNLMEKKPRRKINDRIRRLRSWSCGKYGAARLAVRRAALEAAEIRFSTEFGGGARYGSGEDTLFLKDCLSHGLRIYAVPYALAEIDQSAPSTWFHGYDDKFFEDKGALYRALHPKGCGTWCLRYVLRYRKRFAGTKSVSEAFRLMRKGAREYPDQKEREGFHDIDG